MPNFAYRIDTADHESVIEGISTAPQYDVRVASSIRRVIEVIHGLDDLHMRASLEDIEVYLGRSSDSPEHVLRRWRAHRENHGHRFATVLFTCDAERAAHLEGVAVKLLKSLKDCNTLCVANANVMRGGGGGAPATERAVVYLTWRSDAPPTDFWRPGVDVIRAVAAHVSSDVGHVVAKRQLECGLMALKRLSMRAPMEWYPD